MGVENRRGKSDISAQPQEELPAQGIGKLTQLDRVSLDRGTPSGLKDPFSRPTHPQGPFALPASDAGGAIGDLPPAVGAVAAFPEPIVPADTGEEQTVVTSSPAPENALTREAHPAEVLGDVPPTPVLNASSPAQDVVMNSVFVDADVPALQDGARQLDFYEAATSAENTEDTRSESGYNAASITEDRIERNVENIEGTIDVTVDIAGAFAAKVAASWREFIHSRLPASGVVLTSPQVKDRGITAKVRVESTGPVYTVTTASDGQAASDVNGTDSTTGNHASSQHPQRPVIQGQLVDSVVNSERVSAGKGAGVRAQLDSEKPASAVAAEGEVNASTNKRRFRNI